MNIMSLADIKSRFSEVAESVRSTHERVTVTKNGREHVVLIAAEDLSGLEATLELLTDSAAMARIADSEREIDAGETVSIRDVVANRG